MSEDIYMDTIYWSLVNKDLISFELVNSRPFEYMFFAILMLICFLSKLEEGQSMVSF